ncbi:MAG: DUF1232 domain-containing protein [Anaerolineae bacterium]|nr:DUF1232 domain-containing protein [Anaerolineae bacterium]
MVRQKKSPPDPDLVVRLWNNMVLSWRLMFDRRVSATAKLIPVAVLAYLISPIDLVPDLLLPFGVLDDLGVFVLGLQLFIRSAPPYVLDEYRGGKKRKNNRIRGGTGQSDKTGEPNVIEGQYTVTDEDEQP